MREGRSDDAFANTQFNEASIVLISISLLFVSLISFSLHFPWSCRDSILLFSLWIRFFPDRVISFCFPILIDFCSDFSFPFWSTFSSCFWNCVFFSSKFLILICFWGCLQSDIIRWSEFLLWRRSFKKFCFLLVWLNV